MMYRPEILSLAKVSTEINVFVFLFFSEAYTAYIFPPKIILKIIFSHLHHVIEFTTLLFSYMPSQTFLMLYNLYKKFALYLNLNICFSFRSTLRFSQFGFSLTPCLLRLPFLLNYDLDCAFPEKNVFSFLIFYG